MDMYLKVLCVSVLDVSRKYQHPFTAHLPVSYSQYRLPLTTARVHTSYDHKITQRLQAALGGNAQHIMSLRMKVKNKVHRNFCD
jgi:hypothetical protein